MYRVKPKIKFGVKNEFLGHKNVRNIRKFLENFFKNFQKSLKFLDQNIFGSKILMLISIPKCIELNSKSKPKLILVLVLGLGATQDP